MVLFRRERQGELVMHVSPVGRHWYSDMKVGKNNLIS